MREKTLCVLMGYAAHGYLPKVVRALHHPATFSHGLNGRKEQRKEEPDDRDDDEEFNQRERTPMV